MNYLFMFVAGLIGIFIYALRKIRGIRKRLAVQDYKTVFNEYWKQEWDTIITSIVVVLACMFISKEYLNLPADAATPIGFVGILQYKLAAFVRTTFLVIGYCANSIVDVFLGTTEATLQKKAKEGGADV